MSSIGAAPRAAVTTAAVPLSPARAEASRRNGAKSKGPKTPEGKARSAQNALKHGLRAETFVVLGDEDLGEFDALEAALMAELAPGPVGACLAPSPAVGFQAREGLGPLSPTGLEADGAARRPNPSLALAPQGALQAGLARRIVAATWRLERAERLAGLGNGAPTPFRRPRRPSCSRGTSGAPPASVLP